MNKIIRYNGAVDVAGSDGDRSFTWISKGSVEGCCAKNGCIGAMGWVWDCDVLVEV